MPRKGTTEYSDRQVDIFKQKKAKEEKEYDGNEVPRLVSLATLGLTIP